MSKYVWGFPSDLPWLVVVLLAAGFYVTLRLMFIQLRQVGHAVLVVAGRFDDPEDPGDINHFQALSTALSATVGVGNIAGVATAIHYGGPGAVFWMWVTAVFGMALKFAECTLSVHYRGFDEKGEAAGGPMYYIERGLGPKWKPLAIFFAVCTVLCAWGSGNLNQANTVAVSADADFGIPAWLAGAVLITIVGSVILGGIKVIGRVTSKLAPSMALLYVFSALVILALNAGEIPGAFATILSSAFSPEASLGGSVAGVFSMTLVWGVKRGLFSNEAGQGSAPIAHAAAKTNEPVREGAVAMLGPLIDTLIVCSMTALVIIITGVWDDWKPDRKKLADVAVVVASPDVGESDRSAGEPGGKSVVVQVQSGTQAGLAFKVADGFVKDPRIVAGNKGTPFSGTLVYTPPAKGSPKGTLTTTAADGVTVADLVVEGGMLQNSSALTSWAFARGMSPIGDWGNYIVTFCVFLFAVSTMISWSYYGDRAVTYLFGARYVFPYRILFLVASFIGAITALETVWAAGDVSLGLMTMPNLIAVVLLMPKIVELTRDYFQRMKNRQPGAPAVDTGDN
ncbi:MAG: sodium:alanine symporter family protein [Proteobacteria bacterium]|nr:sodium:alanine symporter family protein [Pseudomonadota bacterium]